MGIPPESAITLIKIESVTVTHAQTGAPIRGFRFLARQEAAPGPSESSETPPAPLIIPSDPLLWHNLGVWTSIPKGCEALMAHLIRT